MHPVFRIFVLLAIVCSLTVGCTKSAPKTADGSAVEPTLATEPAPRPAVVAETATPEPAAEEKTPAPAAEDSADKPGNNILSQGAAAIADGAKSSFEALRDGASLMASRYSADRNRLLGYRSFREKEYETAATYFLACISAEPNDLKSHYYVGSIALNHYKDATYARRHLEQAYTLYQNRADLQQTVTETFNPIENEPNAPAVPWPTQSEVSDMLAESIFAQQNSEAMVVFLRKSIEDRGNAEDYIRMGRYLHKLQDPDSAQGAYMKALQLAGPTDPSAHLAMADFYEAVGNPPLALAQLRQAYGRNPDSPDIHRRLRAHGEVPGPTLVPENKPVLETRPATKLPATGGLKLPGQP